MKEDMAFGDFDCLFFDGGAGGHFYTNTLRSNNVIQKVG